MRVASSARLSPAMSRAFIPTWACILAAANPYGLLGMMVDRFLPACHVWTCGTHQCCHLARAACPTRHVCCLHQRREPLQAHDSIRDRECGLCVLYNLLSPTVRAFMLETNLDHCLAICVYQSSCDTGWKEFQDLCCICGTAVVQLDADGLPCKLSHLCACQSLFDRSQRQ